jgi:hypothetical protein
VLLCNHVFFTAASTPSSAFLSHLATVFPAFPTFTSVVCVIIVFVSVLLLVKVVVHLVPVTPSTSTLASLTLVSQRWAGKVAAAPVAALAKGTEETDSPCVNLCLRRRGLLGLLHLDDAYGVELVIPSIVLINNDIFDHVIPLDD